MIDLIFSLAYTPTVRKGENVHTMEYVKKSVDLKKKTNINKRTSYLIKNDNLATQRFFLKFRQFRSIQILFFFFTKITNSGRYTYISGLTN